MNNSKTMIQALRVLAEEIQSGDGVANACVSDAADMIEMLSAKNEFLEAFLTDRKKRIEALESKNIFVGFTNGHQIHNAKESEGLFYPDTDNECYIPLYMLAIHEHRLGLHKQGESNDD